MYLKSFHIVLLPLLALCSFSIDPHASRAAFGNFSDSLPNVFPANRAHEVDTLLTEEAALKFASHKLPLTKKDWEIKKVALKSELVKKTGAILHQDIPLNFKETGSQQVNGYAIKNVTFQSRPGIYATANLYVPAGEGKFPAVIVMMGHSPNGRFYDKYQEVGITLAQHGYVALCIDPWGSGERTTVDGVFEDHGDDNSLGISLIDVGQTLMGMMITDNIRGVDLLSSLPYVDKERIGATGSSGGGNQTIWLAAMDNRIKAAVPVVSAGTYERFVMGSPCICEILTDGLTFTEEAGVLSLVAPRPFLMSNHFQDANAAFNPREMLKSYKNALPIFKMMGNENNIAYKTFDLAHGYYPEDRLAMLNWFNTHLKKISADTPIIESEIKALEPTSLRVYESGKRESNVISTAQFCRSEGLKLRSKYMGMKLINANAKREELKRTLRISDSPVIKKTEEFSAEADWKRFGLTTSENKSIPVLVHLPSKKMNGFVIISDPLGKKNISQQLIDSITSSGSGMAIVDLSGTGELGSKTLYSNDTLGRLRVYSKSALLLGKTVMGEWVKELMLVNNFIQIKYKPSSVKIYGNKESSLAGLFVAALGENVNEVILSNAPVSYLFDERDGIEYFGTAIHVPGILNWGDVSLAAALTGKKIIFKDPVSISGRKICGTELQSVKNEFKNAITAVGKKNTSVTF